jgi:hypothetical protein
MLLRVAEWEVDEMKNTSSLYYKSFSIVNYDPNLTLALASVFNYDRKWRSKLKHNLWSENFHCTGHSIGGPI